eukprot:7883619-Pyramimonas_sp.AAC.1
MDLRSNVKSIIIEIGLAMGDMPVCCMAARGELHFFEFRCAGIARAFITAMVCIDCAVAIALRCIIYVASLCIQIAWVYPCGSCVSLRSTVKLHQVMFKSAVGTDMHAVVSLSRARGLLEADRA